jgi:hypothetical protein
LFDEAADLSAAFDFTAPKAREAPAKATPSVWRSEEAIVFSLKNKSLNVFVLSHKNTLRQLKTNPISHSIVNHNGCFFVMVS